MPPTPLPFQFGQPYLYHVEPLYPPFNTTLSFTYDVIIPSTLPTLKITGRTTDGISVIGKFVVSDLGQVFFVIENKWVVLPDGVIFFYPNQGIGFLFAR